MSKFPKAAHTQLLILLLWLLLLAKGLGGCTVNLETSYCSHVCVRCVLMIRYLQTLDPVTGEAKFNIDDTFQTEKSFKIRVFFAFIITVS